MKAVLLATAIVTTIALAFPVTAFAADTITPPKLTGPTESCVPYEAYARKEIDEKREVHVITCYNVGLDGKPQDITIAASGGSDIIDMAAKQCVARLSYEPATKNGQPMLFPLVQQFNWCRGEFSPHNRGCKPLPVTADMRAACQKAVAH